MHPQSPATADVLHPEPFLVMAVALAHVLFAALAWDQPAVVATAYAALALAGTAAQADDAKAMAKPAMEKCYGVAKAGKNDCAAELILANKDKVDKVVPHANLIELLVAEMAGGRFKYGEYIDRYMKHDDAFRPISAPERKPSVGEKIRALFR